ncbi:hypothetical protein QP314_11270, partial [Staphylococcus epidermidis]|nr:hypothetical protein [Staphylococcus epidermidis]MDK7077769.1 hypothetical protein [Staphylococcus epidermidis]
SLKTLYRKRTVIWPFYFYTIIRTLSETEDFMFNYSTSKALLSDFQNNNFNHFIQNKKERVIFEDGHFI